MIYLPLFDEVSLDDERELSIVSQPSSHTSHCLHLLQLKYLNKLSNIRFLKRFTCKRLR